MFISCHVVFGKTLPAAAGWPLAVKNHFGYDQRTVSGAQRKIHGKSPGRAGGMSKTIAAHADY
jgi:hypothetical protein